jgi:hypothetical protein
MWNFLIVLKNGKVLKGLRFSKVEIDSLSDGFKMESRVSQGAMFIDFSEVCYFSYFLDEEDE